VTKIATIVGKSSKGFISLENDFWPLACKKITNIFIFLFNHINI
jgi:hypothetical protein